MVYTFLTLLLVVLVARWALRGDERDRVRVLRGGVGCTTLGFALVGLALLTGNLAFYYGGTLLSVVGLPFAVVGLFSVYRDRERSLVATQWRK